MKALSLFLLLFSFTVNAQTLDSIRMKPSEFPPVIVDLPDKSSSEIYSKIKSWINRYYKNPSSVIVADEVENYVRINGATNYTFKYMGTQSYGLLYTLEIEIKDNKYKVSFLNVKSPDLMTPGMPATFYDEKGGYKGKKSINEKMRNAVLLELNNVHFDLYNFINSKTKDW